MKILNCLLLAVIFCSMSVDHDPPFVLHKLPEFINSKTADEIAPIVSLDDQMLYFTRIGDPKFKKTLIYNTEDIYQSLSFQHYNEKIKEVYLELGDQPRDQIYRSPYNQDIYIAEKKDNQFVRLVHPDHPLNNALPNSVCALMPDQKTLVLLNQFYRSGSMYKGFSTSQQLAEGAYEFPEPLFIYGFNEQSGSEANLCLSKNGEIMILAYPKEGDNNTDLYLSFRINSDTYSEPVPLPAHINSPAREFSPSLSEDGKYLFFSSTRGIGQNNSDIFVSTRLDDTYLHWSKPMRLGEPINSSANEGHPYIVGKKLYFSSDRDGSWDIFYIDMGEDPAIDEEEEEIAFKKQELNAVADQETVTVDNRAAQIREPATSSKTIANVRIKVVNSETYQPITTQVSMIKSGQETQSILNVDKDGFILAMDDPGIIIFEPQTDQYISKPLTVDVKSLVTSSRIMPEVTLKVDPIKVNARITIDPIYFNKGRDRILPVSYPVIQRLVDIMKKHKDLNILIEGHTDNFGDEDALQELSEKRAYAVKNFLHSQGINPQRISTRGFGRSRPITDNSTEYKKAQNRRVEIVITKI